MTKLLGAEALSPVMSHAGNARLLGGPFAAEKAMRIAEAHALRSGQNERRVSDRAQRALEHAAENAANTGVMPRPAARLGVERPSAAHAHGKRPLVDVRAPDPLRIRLEHRRCRHQAEERPMDTTDVVVG